MRQACHAGSVLRAEGLLAELDRTHTGAAARLREGMAKTLTIVRLGVPPTPARTQRCANPAESLTGICREHPRNVQRWRNGQMALCWFATAEVTDSSARARCR